MRFTILRTTSLKRSPVKEASLYQESRLFQIDPVTRKFIPGITSEGEKLRQIAGYMKHARNNIILAGFTDERGTPEYNRGLGERRAQAARSFLLSAGVSPTRIQTVSFAQEMPAESRS
jgi:flagellar motor protein MotB